MKRRLMIAEGHNLVLIPLISAGSLKSTMQHIFRLMKL
ncbi:hypothetical protein CAter282_0420 [Collimonas arenae]|uniref:Uncharacterized protein n=1 Tax=Collimonas arenae TaxID=279058 RepID=A0A127QE08_9BURK|nr:hypothetical protein CAter282_0420 [Collimonas arenae]